MSGRRPSGAAAGKVGKVGVDRQRRARATLQAEALHVSLSMKKRHGRHGQEANGLQQHATKDAPYLPRPPDVGDTLNALSSGTNDMRSHHALPVTVLP
jgi:hypothetical protein